MLLRAVLFHTLVWVVIMQITHKYLHGQQSFIPTIVAYVGLLITVSWKTVLKINIFPYNQIIYLNSSLGLAYVIGYYNVIDLTRGWLALIMLGIGGLNFLIIWHIHKVYKAF